MIGLAYLIFFALYLGLAIALIKITKKIAKKRNKKFNIWGVLIGIGMAGVLFWDVIPVYAAHQYYCSSQSGIKIYKTLEAWKQENPGVKETLTPLNNESKNVRGAVRYEISQRFVWDNRKYKQWYIVFKKEEKIIDTQTNEIMAEYVDFYTNIKSPLSELISGPRDLKIWLMIDTCEKTSSKLNRKKFSEFMSQIKF